jgi:hypothetical protein
LNALHFGSALTRERLLRRWVLAPLLLACVVIAVTAASERAESATLATDRTLVGAVFGLTVPLIAYGAVGLLTMRSRMSTAVEAVARHGADRRRLVLGAVVSAQLAAAGACAALAILAVIATRGSSLTSLLSSAVSGALLGAAYTGWFAFGSSFGPRGQGRVAALILDWLLGASSTLFAFWPRGHVAALVSAGANGSSMAFAWAALLVLSTMYAIAGFIRCPR